MFLFKFELSKFKDKKELMSVISEHTRMGNI